MAAVEICLTGMSKASARRAGAVVVIATKVEIKGTGATRSAVYIDGMREPKAEGSTQHTPQQNVISTRKELEIRNDDSLG